MLCPHCGHDNVDGRKYCRACAKPLASDVKVARPALNARPGTILPASTPDPISVSPPAGVVNGMAIASLALSFVAFILPLGIAAAVMGHISRKQIAKSQGRQTGTGLAFAGLVITYLQFAAVIVVCFALIAALGGMNRDLDRNRHARAALLEAMYSYHRPTADDYARQRRNAVDALRLIHADESDYLAAHPDEGYACAMYQFIGPVTTNEVNMHIATSHYEVKIDQCRGADMQHVDDRVYAAVAIPRSDSNPPDAPAYCVDQTGVVRRYAPGMINDLHRVILFEHKSCLESGEPVE
jgi:large-conductance mechanosensitive channel